MLDEHLKSSRAQELCESQGGHFGLPVPNSMYHLCACKATLKITIIIFLLDCLPGPAYSKFIELKIFKNAPLVNYILLECHIYITTAISEKWV